MTNTELEDGIFSVLSTLLTTYTTEPNPDFIDDPEADETIQVAHIVPCVWAMQKAPTPTVTHVVMRHSNVNSIGLADEEFDPDVNCLVRVVGTRETVLYLTIVGDGCADIAATLRNAFRCSIGGILFEAEELIFVGIAGDVDLSAVFSDGYERRWSLDINLRYAEDNISETPVDVIESVDIAGSITDAVESPMPILINISQEIQDDQP